VPTLAPRPCERSPDTIPCQSIRVHSLELAQPELNHTPRHAPDSAASYSATLPKLAAASAFATNALLLQFKNRRRAGTGGLGLITIWGSARSRVVPPRKRARQQRADFRTPSHVLRTRQDGPSCSIVNTPPIILHHRSRALGLDDHDAARPNAWP